jgi:hypothetical protein
MEKALVVVFQKMKSIAFVLIVMISPLCVGPIIVMLPYFIWDIGAVFTIIWALVYVYAWFVVWEHALKLKWNRYL